MTSINTIYKVYLLAPPLLFITYLIFTNKNFFQNKLCFIKACDTRNENRGVLKGRSIIFYKTFIFVEYWHKTNVILADLHLSPPPSICPWSLRWLNFMVTLLLYANSLGGKTDQNYKILLSSVSFLKGEFTFFDIVILFSSPA